MVLILIACHWLGKEGRRLGHRIILQSPTHLLGGRAWPLSHTSANCSDTSVPPSLVPITMEGLPLLLNEDKVEVGGAIGLRCTGFSSCLTWAQQLQLPGSRAQASNVSAFYNVCW